MPPVPSRAIEVPDSPTMSELGPSIVTGAPGSGDCARAGDAASSQVAMHATVAMTAPIRAGALRTPDAPRTHHSLLSAVGLTNVEQIRDADVAPARFGL